MEGLRRIGYFCSYVPEEILSVPGLYGYRMRAPNTKTTETADSYLGLFNCSYTRAMLETILGRMNVPTKSDIETLSAKISELSRKVDELKGL